MERAMWVFGYGSLMGDGWEARFGCIRRLRAELLGYKRTFNKASVRNWGTKAYPCPTLNLLESESSSCHGIAFEFPADRGVSVQSYLIEREGKGFELHTLAVQLDDGSRVRALVPIYRGKNLLAVRDVDAIAAMMLRARGTDGSGKDYIRRVADELRKAEIDDRSVNSLEATVARLAKSE